MNYILVEPVPEGLDEISIDTVKRVVEESGSEWVFISGGEPTYEWESILGDVQRRSTVKEVLDLIWYLSYELKCKVGLSTNGTNRESLEKLLPHVDYVALDIKTSTIEGYRKFLGATWKQARNVISSIRDLAVEKKTRMEREGEEFDWEIRTTLYPALVSLDDIERIGPFISPGDKWFLQQYRKTNKMLCVSASKQEPYGDKDLNILLMAARKYTDNAELRYV